MTYFLFLRSLVSAAGKCLLTLFCKLLAPMVQCAVGDSQIACNLRLRFVARSHQLDRFLLKFSCKGSLLLLHDPFPFCGESTLSSLHPPLLWVKTKHLGEASGVLVVGETGFVKKGKKAASRARH